MFRKLVEFVNFFIILWVDWSNCVEFFFLQSTNFEFYKRLNDIPPPPGMSQRSKGVDNIFHYLEVIWQNTI